MADITSENHARLIWVLMVVLYCVIALRYWALRRVTYDKLSPRGISSMCIIATVIMVTVLASITTWSLVGPYKNAVSDIQDSLQGTNLKDDAVNISQIVGANAGSSANATASSTTGAVPAIVTASGSPNEKGPTATIGDNTITESSTTAVSEKKDNKVTTSTSSASSLSTAAEEESAAQPTVIGAPGPKKGTQAEAEAIAAKLGLSLLPPAPVKRAEATLSPTGVQRRAEESSAPKSEAQKVADAKEALKNASESDDPGGFTSTQNVPTVGDIDSVSDIPEGIDIQISSYEQDVDAEPKFETIWKVNFASMAIYYTVLWLVKASFIVIYFEFSKDLTVRTRRLLYVSSLVMFITYAFVMLVHLMWCLPMELNWDFNSLVNPGSCRAEIAPSVINSVINVMTDLLLMCAGFAIIRSLNLGRSDFRAAFLIILIGCLTMLVAVVRLICLIVVMHKENKNLKDSSDGQNIVELPVQESVMGYPEVEAILAAMATCLPALRVLFRHSTGKTFASSSAPPTYNTTSSHTNLMYTKPALEKEIC